MVHTGVLNPAVHSRQGCWVTRSRCWCVWHICWCRCFLCCGHRGHRHCHHTLHQKTTSTVLQVRVHKRCGVVVPNTHFMCVILIVVVEPDTLIVSQANSFAVRHRASSIVQRNTLFSDKVSLTVSRALHVVHTGVLNPAVHRRQGCWVTYWSGCDGGSCTKKCEEGGHLPTFL